MYKLVYFLQSSATFKVKCANLGHITVCISDHPESYRKNSESNRIRLSQF